MPHPVEDCNMYTQSMVWNKVCEWHIIQTGYDWSQTTTGNASRNSSYILSPAAVVSTEGLFVLLLSETAVCVM